ncbi:YjzD family protein [Fictibacillus sp. KIGAM418]|uniref:YjzD family protein n=1 Tax=Fictibacillus marinisediminis TaxID=2878389 RepID=A0A9X1X9W6_9BACL|nr:YjzD family protein [Fictibacillus marinisediminis]MCK6256731.1 YjzD family protein [Fictibacillus marinisediminis]
MRYFWTLIWSLLLSNMAFYVLASMQGGAYDFAKATTFGVVFAVFIMIIGAVLPNEAETAE